MEFRICKNHGEVHLDKWRVYNRRGKKVYVCRLCSVIHSRKYREEHPEKVRSSKYSKINDIAAHINKLKSNPCVDCHTQYEPWCMEFDHISLKRGNISFLVTQRYSIEYILEEIGKTELVCVLCHRNRSHNRKPGLSSNNPSRIKRISSKQKIVDSLKNLPCEICDTRYEPWQMDFDHIDQSTKRMSICHMIRHEFSIEAIKLEIKKCRLLCAVCHRRHTVDSSSTPYIRKHA